METTVRDARRDFAALIVYQIIGGVVSFLVFRYDKLGKRTQLKFPGGMTEGEELPDEVVRREAEEETGLVVKFCDLGFERRVATDHSQFFYFTNFGACEGKLRTEPLMDGDERLGEPFWISSELELRSLFPSHKEGLRGSLRAMAQGDSTFKAAAKQTPFLAEYV